MEELKLVETDSYTILNNLIKYFEESYGEILYPGDERRIFLHNLGQVIVSILNTMNEKYKSNFLRYAAGNVLEKLGELFNTERLPATKSKTSIKFNLSKAQDKPYSINKGTKVTPDGVSFFITMNELIIPVGKLYGEVTAESMEAGEKYNGFLPGQIKNLVDPIPYVQSIENTITSYGGTDAESDEDLRERIHLAPNSFSVAGPEGAYEYHAKSVDNSINCVKVVSPSPGVVKIILLLKNGVLPDSELLNKVKEHLNDYSVRPLTDKVEVCAPEVINYNIKFTYYILKEDMAQEIIIKENVKKAVEEYTSFQKSNLGKAINPDTLRKLVLNAGANRIVVESPLYLEVEDSKVAIASNTEIIYGGLE